MVSIIIPCFNDSFYIEEAIDSAIAQTNVNKEIIVVDDGSDPENKKVLQGLASKIDILIHQENKGVSVARNRGISAAQGKYITVLDSDDFFEPQFCEKAIKIFSNNSNAKIVTCYSRWFNSKSSILYKPQGGALRNYLLKNEAMGSVMFLKNDWLKAGGYDEQMKIGFEDWEFYIRLHKNGGETIVIPEVLFHYRKKIKSRSTVANDFKFDLLKYIYIKHQNLYKSNFELLVNYFVTKTQKEEQTNIRIKNSEEYRIGKILLSPIRYFKSIFS